MNSATDSGNVDQIRTINKKQALELIGFFIAENDLTDINDIDGFHQEIAEQIKNTHLNPKIVIDFVNRKNIKVSLSFHFPTLNVEENIWEARSYWNCSFFSKDTNETKYLIDKIDEMLLCSQLVSDFLKEYRVVEKPMVLH